MSLILITSQMGCLLRCRLSLRKHVFFGMMHDLLLFEKWFRRLVSDFT